MEKVRYETMLPHEIVARRRRMPAAFIALGGLEWHGEHLAVGNDALKAEKLAELAAAQCGGFAMPTLWYGEPRTVGLMEANHNDGHGITDKMDLPASNFSTRQLGISKADQAAFYEQLVFHTLAQMNALGMKAVVLVSGHYPLVNWANKAIARFRKARRFAGTRAFCAVEPFFLDPPNHDVASTDHAAYWETSYLMYLRPECVDMSVYNGRDDEQLVGLMGIDPRGKASVEVGRRAVRAIVKAMVAKAKALLAEVR